MNLSLKNRVNISIDDISPHPQSSAKVLHRCFDLIKIFEDIKFTIFVPLYYTRYKQKSYPLSEDVKTCELLRKLPQKNFEIGYHGYFHGIPDVSSNDEFQSLSYNQAVSKFAKMKDEAKKAGLSGVFKNIFRPPAWRMSPESITAAIDLGIEVLALSPDKYAKDTYGGEDNKHNKVIYYNVCPPQKPLQLYEKTEIVYHACEWDTNYLSVDKMKNLKNFLLNHRENINFCFMKEMLDADSRLK